MIRELVELNSVVLTKESGLFRRDPKLGQDLPGWKATDPAVLAFDSETLAYDVFKDGGGISIIMPPLYNLRDALVESLAGVNPSVDSEREMIEGDRFTHLYLGNFERESVDFEAPVSRVAHVGESYVSVLAGCRALVTLSKDNELSWIYDWALFYVMNHDVNAVVFFDNASTKYTPQDILDTLARVPGLEYAYVLSAPFKFGRPGHCNFLEHAVLNIAHRRFLAQAELVFQVDIDELIATRGKLSVARAMQTSSYLRVESFFVENSRDIDKEFFSFRDFRYTKRDRTGESSAPKYVYSPQARDQTYLSVHWLLARDPGHPGALRRDLIPFSDDFAMLHFRGVSDNWSNRQNRRPKVFTIADMVPLPRVFRPALERAFGPQMQIDCGLIAIDGGGCQVQALGRADVLIAKSRRTGCERALLADSSGLIHWPCIADLGSLQGGHWDIFVDSSAQRSPLPYLIGDKRESSLELAFYAEDGHLVEWKTVVYGNIKGGTSIAFLR